MDTKVKLEPKHISSSGNSVNLLTLDPPNKTKAFKSLREIHNMITENKELSDKEKSEKLNTLLEKSFSLLEDTLETENRIYQKGFAVCAIGKQILSQEHSKEMIEKRLVPAIQEFDQEIESLGLKSRSLETNTRFNLAQIPDCGELIKSTTSLLLEIQQQKKSAIEKDDHSALISLSLKKANDLKQIKENIEKSQPLVLGWLENTIKLIKKNEQRLFDPSHIGSISKQTAISEENLKTELQIREKQIQELKNAHDKVANEWFQIIETSDQIAYSLQESEFRGKNFGAIAQGQRRLEELLSEMTESTTTLEKASQSEFGVVYKEQNNKAETLSNQLEIAQKNKSESLQKAEKSFAELGVLQKQIKQETNNRFEKLHLYNQEISKEIAKKSEIAQEVSDKEFQTLSELYQSKVDEMGKKEGSCLIKKQELSFEIAKTKICDEFLKEFSGHYSNVENYASSVKKKEFTFLVGDLEENHRKFMEKSDQLRENSVKTLQELLKTKESNRILLNDSLKKIVCFGNGVQTFFTEEENFSFKGISEKSNNAIQLVEKEWNMKLKKGVDDLSTICVQHLIDTNQEEFEKSVKQYKLGFESDKSLEKENKTLTGAIENFKKLYRERKASTILETELNEFEGLVKDYNKNCSGLGEINKQAFENMKKELSETSQNLGSWVEKLKTYETSTNSTNIEIFSKSAKEQNNQLERLAIEHKDLWSCMDSLFGGYNKQQSFAYEICRIKYAMNRGSRVLPKDSTFQVSLIGWWFEERDLAVKSPSDKNENK